MDLIIYSGTGEEDGGGKGEVLGTAASDKEAQMLALAFPGAGQCHFWSPTENRIVRIVSWQNKRKAN